MTAALLALVAAAVAALVWRMRVDDRRVGDLLAKTTRLGEVTVELELAELARAIAEDGVAALHSHLEDEQARAAAVVAELEAKLARATARLAELVPAAELPSVINDILTPRSS